ncbi:MULTISPECIES: undecaprenyl-phosphate galactose phosphotransferase WbaP [Glaesserella]|uniref:UDP-phosphate galactose phosphotransferase n=1 Tax=Glaesserella australis TaxID=2094024 RepID=A0A328BV13_9PAST|nr:MULTISPECIES: undecaprenyl-phosphate galactose phosphotransferase WbaP [Glaesserella]AUI67109.1 UDP-phosphate galactose phosphotransferase [Glaesserella sp. 15-184]RAL18148.1 UDP-phosphate galactose phosphotransferase [Glaesserella australis]
MEKQVLSKYILASVDFFLCFIASILSTFLIYLWFGELNSYIPHEQLKERLFIHLILTIICIVWFWIRLRHYTYRKPFWFELKEIFRTLIIISIIELAIITFSKLYFSRYLWVFTWMIALVLVPIGRVLIKTVLIRTKYFLKDTIIIGGGKNAIDAYHALMSEPYLGFRIKYFIATNQSNELRDLNIPIINETRQSIWELVTKKTDQFIIALEDEESEERDRWLRYLSKKFYRSVSVIPTLRGLPLYSTDMSFIFSYDVILLRINNNLAKRSSRIIKRLVDIFLSLVFIILLSPVLVTIFCLIKKDGGPAIYGHSRIGQNGKIFKCLKFRSMVINSEQILSELLENNEEARREWERDFKLKIDPRITPVGRFLRQSSLDELPQLFNVLVGQMSLVGPRPVVKEELAYYQEDVDYYLMAKPGMTGLWQVSGRNNVDYETRVYFDSWYVKNWSLWNDIAILFKTINAVLRKNGAY